MTSLTDTALQQHYKSMRDFDMRDVLDADRAQKLSTEAAGLFLDYSKNLINDESLVILLQLAQDKQVLDKFKSQLAGEVVNPTENQAATHTAMRGDGSGTAELTEEVAKVVDDALQERQKIYQINQQLVAGKLLGVGGRPINRVINLGIGGSYLGGAMVCNALPPQKNAPQVDFVSSLSPTALHINSKEELESCLIILSSKSFSTEETLASAYKLLDYYVSGDNTARQDFLANNFYAVTAAPQKAIDFGIKQEKIFHMAQTIGGRFSLWSAIGTAIIFHGGQDAFEELLQGAAKMDEHCATAEADKNMPLLLALLSYWYVNYFNTSSICVNAYENCLADLPMFLQQLVMESCGKQAKLTDGSLSAKSEVLWGGEGTAVQHSYMQLCHQGNQLIPIDFIVGANPPAWHKPSETEVSMQRSLVAHCLAQSQTLLSGRSVKEARNEAKLKGLPDEYISHLVMPGNRPSNTIVYAALSPAILGAIIALYENKTALFAYLSDINPFDQWGVELGKVLSSKIKSNLEDGVDVADYNDPSTTQLITHIKSLELESK